MGARTIAVAMLVVFFIIILQVTLAGPLTSVADTINGTGDYSDFDRGTNDGNQIITDFPAQWFSMGIVAIFGTLVWATWRVLRRELTRGGGGGL